MFVEVEVPGARVAVHHVVHGPQDPGTPTAVLLHGIGVDHRLMAGAYEPAFAARRTPWRRVYLDLPGMGGTAAPDGVQGSDDVLAVVRAAVAALVPHAPYAVLGQSYGGYLARGLVAADQDRVTGLALTVPIGVEVEAAARTLPAREVLVRSPELLAEVGATRLDADPFGVVQTLETWRRTAAEVEPGVEAGDVPAMTRIVERYVGTFPLEGDVPAFDRPTLVVVGRQDSTTGYRDQWPLLEHYPRATFAVLDRGGHHVHLEQPALFTALTHEWLDRVEEAASA